VDEVDEVDRIKMKVGLDFPLKDSAILLVFAIMPDQILKIK